MASIFGKNFKTFDELKSTLEKNVYLVPFLLAIGYWLLAIGYWLLASYLPCLLILKIL